jgi:pyrimidine operon attenuation protein/uracil phosphoribosyltransferase
MRSREAAKENMENPTKEPATVVVMDADAIRKAIRRIAHEIIEQNPDLSRVVLAGIPTRGVEVARRIADHIASVESVRPETGIVDVSMHRDDLATRRRLTAVEASQLPFDLEGRTLVLIDDVLYTGRSCRAAMDAVASFGRPDRIQFAVLVDRGHRELPIRADFVGRNVPTEPSEKIRVRFENVDGAPDSVAVVKS